MIDAHQHFWRLGANDCTWPTPAQSAIHRDFLPEHWPGGDSILIQSQESMRDTEWLLALAERHDFIRGVVGWSDLKSPLPESPWLRGVRPMVQGHGADWFDDPALDFRTVADRGLNFDALVRPRHLASLERMARRHPGLRIVIDHAAKPNIVTGDLESWREGMAHLSELPNVACKLSGLLTEAAPGQQEEVVRIGEWLFAAFGPDRLIWGSDWPVLNLAASYGEWLGLAHAIVPFRAHEAVFGGNARRIYRLGE